MLVRSLPRRAVRLVADRPRRRPAAASTRRRPDRTTTFCTSTGRIGEHTLKTFFQELHAADKPVGVNVSPSYADGVTVGELLDLEPSGGARKALLGAALGSYTEDFGGERLRAWFRDVPASPSSLSASSLTQN